MAIKLEHTTTVQVVCDNVYCGAVVPPGAMVYPARLRDDVYCSPKCRNRHMRRLVQDRRRADPEKNLIDNKRRRFKKYGITAEDYDDLYEAQDGECAICGKEFEDRYNDPHIDHDHTTLAVRGLLCGACNVGVGYFYDDPGSLRAAATYLETSASAFRSEKGEGVTTGGN